MKLASYSVLFALVLLVGCFSSPAPSQLPQMPPVTVTQTLPVPMPPVLKAALANVAAHADNTPQGAAFGKIIAMLQVYEDMAEHVQTVKVVVPDPVEITAVKPNPSKAAPGSALIEAVEWVMWIGAIGCLIVAGICGYKLAWGKAIGFLIAAGSILVGGYLIIGIIKIIWYLVWGGIILVGLFALYRYHDQVFAEVKKLWNSDQAQALEAHIAALPAAAATAATKVVAGLETEWAAAHPPTTPVVTVADIAAQIGTAPNPGTVETK